ncbi:hypothetical protein ACIA8R_38235 [Nonomuraea sp. NPDC051191]|uniref:hypothetical protein n=1 Tax=Nonomuraea sp. NPDC051191 TaxID=3364372 RepID=UPI0037AE0F8C
MSLRAYAVALTAVLLVGGLLWLAYGPERDVPRAAHTAAPTSTPVPVIRSTQPPPELLESCADTSDAKRCERGRALLDACEEAGFTGRRCRGSEAVQRDRKAFLTDCRRADVVVRDTRTCARDGESAARAYLYCRFAGGTDRRCERPAVYTVCVRRGGGMLCGDAAPGYDACRARTVEGTEIARHICVEGIEEYAFCRYGWTLTSEGGDICRHATAVYEDCRTRAPVAECEQARHEDAKAQDLRQGRPTGAGPPRRRPASPPAPSRPRPARRPG